jgi:hypothetical protein
MHTYSKKIISVNTGKNEVYWHYHGQTQDQTTLTSLHNLENSKFEMNN